MVNEEGKTVNDPFLMSEILRKHYESAFSTPDPDFNMETLGEHFFKAAERNDEERGGTEEEEGEKVEDRGEKEEEGGGKKDVAGENTAHEQRPAVQYPPELASVHFDYMDIADAIDQLSLYSGPGPDGIPAILLKKSKLTVSLMLYNIFHNSITKSEIPDILKLGFICPILKPDSKRERAASWRPVSITSHVMKTLERVIRKQIVSHLETNDLMDPDQHGSRQKRSCLSQLLEHHDDILKVLEEGGNVDVIYTDFAKAYDKVDHAKLLNKMKNKFGIQGRLGIWLKKTSLKTEYSKFLLKKHCQENLLLSKDLFRAVYFVRCIS